MTATPPSPTGRAIAIAFLIITVAALTPAILWGSWWNLLLIVAIPAGLIGIIGLAIELSKKGKPKP